MRYGRLLLFLAALLFAGAVTPSLYALDPPMPMPPIPSLRIAQDVPWPIPPDSPPLIAQEVPWPIPPTPPGGGTHQ